MSEVSDQFNGIAAGYRERADKAASELDGIESTNHNSLSVELLKQEVARLNFMYECACLFAETELDSNA